MDWIGKEGRVICSHYFLFFSIYFFPLTTQKIRQKKLKSNAVPDNLTILKMVMVRKPGAYHPQGLIAVTSGCNTVSKVGLEVERTGGGGAMGGGNYHRPTGSVRARRVHLSGHECVTPVSS